MSSFSENEDDPVAFESSGSEWDEAEEKKRNKRRTSQRLSKKPKIVHEESSDDSTDSKDKKKVVTKRKPAAKNNGINKQKEKKHQAPTTTRKDAESKDVKRAPKIVTSNTKFQSGMFVIAKKDIQSDKLNKPPCLWKIDGKALLQKYEPFDQGGKLMHRTTSVYTGWSSLDQDLYLPIDVEIHKHFGQKMEVEANLTDLKTLDNDSD